MPRYRVVVETATTVSHFVTVEAEDPDAAKASAEELVMGFEEDMFPGEGDEEHDYREGGIGGWTTTEDVGEILEGGVIAWAKFRCLDCGRDTGETDLMEYPLSLREEVWRSIVPDGKGMLCRADMERRLGRPLTEADFPPRIGSAEQLEEAWRSMREDPRKMGMPSDRLDEYREAFDRVMATDPPDAETATRRFEGWMGWDDFGWKSRQEGHPPGWHWISGRLGEAVMGRRS